MIRGKCLRFEVITDKYGFGADVLFIYSYIYIQFFFAEMLEYCS